MSISERLATAPGARTNNRSAMDIWVDTLTPEDRAAVQKATTDTAWGHVALRDALHAEGAPFLADTTFRAWRKKHGWKA